MKKSIYFLSVAALILTFVITEDAFSRSRKAATRAHRKAAKAKCKEVREKDGIECQVQRRWCKRGYRPVGTFGRGKKGVTMKACILSHKHKQRKRKQAGDKCAKYVEANPGSDCLVKKGICPAAMRALKVFKVKGRNLRVCVSKASLKNHNENKARAHCDKLKEKGVKCKVTHKLGCGIGWKTKKKYGKRKWRWRVCVMKRRKKGSIRNKRRAKAACARWLEKNPGKQCIVDKRACPIGWVAIKKYRKGGVTYSACRTRK